MCDVMVDWMAGGKGREVCVCVCGLEEGMMMIIGGMGVEVSLGVE